MKRLLPYLKGAAEKDPSPSEFQGLRISYGILARDRYNSVYHTAIGAVVYARRAYVVSTINMMWQDYLCHFSNAASRFAKRSHSALVSYLEDFEAEVREKKDVNDCHGPTPSPSPVSESPRRPEMKLPPKDMPDLPEILWRYSKYKSYLNCGRYLSQICINISIQHRRSGKNLMKNYTKFWMRLMMMSKE